MAQVGNKNALVTIDTYIGSNDPDKGVLVDSNKFQSLHISTNIFSITPICKISYIFDSLDEKPKVYDTIYINVYKVLVDNGKKENKGSLWFSTPLLILSSNVSTVNTPNGNMEKYTYVCAASSLFTLTNKLNIAYKNTSGKDVLKEALNISDGLNASINELEVDKDYPTNYDTMNWVFSQKTPIEITKKVLKHMNVGDNDIPLLYSRLNTQDGKIRINLSTLNTLVKKDSLCTLTDARNYDTIDEENKKDYLKYSDKVIGKLKGAIPLLSNGLGQMLYQYNPWGDQDFGDGLTGIIARAIQFAKDFETETLNPSEHKIRHPDVEDNNCVYRAYESYNYDYAALMPGTAIKPSNANTNKSTLKFVGINTTDLHSQYNFNPYIYENIVRNFFSNGVMVMCYINSQNERFNELSNFPKLGDCVDISMNSESDVENFRNGKYLIGKYDIDIQSLQDTPTITYRLYRDTIYLDRPRSEGEEI